MFGDCEWIDDRTSEQESRYQKWLMENRSANLTIIELGAGNGVPTVRYQSERVLRESQGKQVTLIRINPREQNLMMSERDYSVFDDTDFKEIKLSQKNII